VDKKYKNFAANEEEVRNTVILNDKTDDKLFKIIYTYKRQKSVNNKREVAA